MILASTALKPLAARAIFCLLLLLPLTLPVARLIRHIHVDLPHTLLGKHLPQAVHLAVQRLTHTRMTFTYVSGAGTGSQSAMWARVKRRTEQDLLALPCVNWPANSVSS